MCIYFWSRLFCEAVARVLAGAPHVAIFILNPLLSGEVSASPFCTLCTGLRQAEEQGLCSLSVVLV